MSLIHLARQGFITKSALPNVTRQRGTTTGTANLMLYGAGKDFAIGTNTTFTDSSTNAFTVTRNGDTIQATNNPFTGSVYFDGTDDYLSVANNTALQPGTGTFTIECWIYRGVAGAAHTIYAKGGTSTGFVFQVTSSNTLRFTDTTTNIDSTGTIPALTWTHVAVARSGTGSNQTKLFINGVVDGQGTVATDFNQTEEVRIGTDRSAASDFNGWISCLRFVKGSAVYTANFAVPTSPLTAITNTQLLLLTAQQAPLRDSSSNAFTVTANGNAAGSGLEPFPVNYAGSAYFDGTGDYLSVANNAAFDFGTGDFTIEAYVYIAGNSSLDGSNRRYANIFSLTTASAWPFGFAIQGNSTTTGTGLEIVNGTTAALVSTTIQQSTWNHIAVVRSGSSAYFFVNGTQVGTTQSISGSWGSSTVAGQIGQTIYTSYNYPLNGYISNLRIVKGTAVYTAAFTPPSAPLTAVTNTSLLLLTNNVGPFVDTSANGFPILRNGDAVQTGFSPFTGQPSAGAAYFDGTGDYLTFSPGNTFQFGTGDFTVEMFVNFSNASNAYLFFVDARNSSQTNTWAFWRDTTGNLTWYTGSADLASSATNLTATNVWHHIAYTRTSNTGRMFINGTLAASFTDSNNYSISPTKSFVGCRYNLDLAVTGYISNLRVIKGTALYTSNFTPATAPLPAVPNTSLLLNTDNYTIANSTSTYLPVTVNGNTTVSTAQYPTGMNRSIYFDGTGDYLSNSTNNSSIAFGSGDFTLEFYIYSTSTATQVIYDTRITVGGAGNDDGAVQIYRDSTTIYVYDLTGASTLLASTSISTNVWTHFAVVRSGSATGNVKLYKDGVLASSSASANTTNYTKGYLNIGTWLPAGVPSNFFVGYLSNFRIVKGSALYTANFTPPSLPMSISVTVPAYVTNNIYGVYQLA